MALTLAVHPATEPSVAGTRTWVLGSGNHWSTRGQYAHWPSPPLASSSQVVERTTRFPYGESHGGTRLRNRRVYALNSSIWLVLTVIITQPQTSFLDLPAVTTSHPTDDDILRQQSMIGVDHDHTFFDLPPTSQSRARNPNSNPHPSGSRGSAFSWKALPRLLFRRPHDSSPRLEVTTIYPGYAPQRTYVASAGDETSTETPLEPIPTTPGDYGRYSVILISGSDSDSPEGDQASRELPVEKRSPFYCGLFSRRKASTETVHPSHPPIELFQRTAPSSGASAPPVTTAMQTTTQDMLDLPAIVGPSSDTA
ncbi:hypothetical protein HYDPIDRAFT_26539 [Hydnomerulius pinastri MD-312]|nr:hypothetical protein HYDPIDRAFT_26539 [Hydnomerulius pinastri MD-312]